MKFVHMIFHFELEYQALAPISYDSNVVIPWTALLSYSRHTEKRRHNWPPNIHLPASPTVILTE